MSSEEPPTRDSTLRYKDIPIFLGNSISISDSILNPNSIETTYFSQNIFATTDTISHSNSLWRKGLAEFYHHNEDRKIGFQI